MNRSPYLAGALLLNPRRGLLLLTILASAVPLLGSSTTPGRSLESTEACELYENERPDQAYPRLLDLAERDRSECVFLYKGLIERSRGNLVQATETFRQGVVLTDSVLTALELAMTLAWQEKFDDAIAIYRDLGVDHSLGTQTRLGLARVLAWRGDLGEAGTLYDELLSEDPESVPAMNGLAFVLRTRLKERSAKDLYRRVLELDPGNEEALEGMRALLKSERWRLGLTTHRQTLGATSETSSEKSHATSFDLSYKLAPMSALSLVFQEDGLAVDDLADVVADVAGQIESQLSLGWSFALGERNQFEASYQRQERTDVSGTDEFFGIDWYRHRETSGAWIASARQSRLVDDDKKQYLFHFGALLTPAEGHEVLAQVFYNTDFDGDDGYALVGSWRYDRTDRFYAKGGAGLGENFAGSFTLYTAQLGVNLGPRIEAVLGHELYRGSFNRESSQLGLNLRF